MRFRFIFTLYTLLVVTSAYAAADSLTVNVNNNLLPTTSYTGFVMQNPAAMLYTRYSDITEFGIAAGKDNGDAALLQNGTRKDEYKLHVNTLQHLQSNPVWGNVSYRRGSVDDVRWNESADYLIIYPYVINDTIGGDNLKMEEYRFSFGYAHNLNRWTLGAELDYRALKEYRTLDPRPDNTVSDLYLRGGASYKLTPNHVVGLGVYYRKYKQENTLTFYNKLGAPWIHHDTGMGTNAYMFGGINGKAMLDGNSYGVNLQLIPANFYGLTASIAYDYFYYEKQLADISYLPISELDKNSFLANISYTKKQKNRVYGVKLSASRQDREGTEHLFNIVASNTYQKISSNRMYSHKISTAELSLLYGVENINKLSWHIAPSVIYIDSKEKYKNPLREMSFSSVSEGVNGYLSFYLKKVLIAANASIYLTQNISKKLLLTGLDDTAYASHIMHQNYAFLSSNNIAYRLSIRSDFPVSKKYALFFKANGGYASHSYELNRYELSISIGMVF